MTKLVATQNPLQSKQRIASIEILNKLLSVGMDLASRAKHAHWNIRGPGFIALHEQFDAIAGVVSGVNDTLAERVAQLGGLAQGMLMTAVQQSNLPVYPHTSHDIATYIKALSQNLALWAQQLNQGSAHLGKKGDPRSADLCAESACKIEKQLWLLEANI